MSKYIAIALCLGTLVFAASASAAPLATTTTIQCNEQDLSGAGEQRGLCMVTVRSPESTGTITGFAPVTGDGITAIPFSPTVGFKLNRVKNGESTLVFVYEAATAGPHTLAANYSGDVNHAPSQGSLAVNVPAERHKTATTVTCGTLKVGQPATCSAVVRDVSATRTSPTGSVRFVALGGNVGEFISTPCRLIAFSLFSFCSITFTPDAAGVDGALGIYDGDRTHRPSEAEFKLVVNP
jgi:hypothetical protein